MLSKMPLILAITILSVIFFGEIIPINLKQMLYAISLAAKSIIVFLLPIIIFCLLFRSTVNLAKDTTRLILLIVISVCCSNFIATFLSQYVGIWIYNFDMTLAMPQENNSLLPSWELKLPTIIPNNEVMLAAIVFGIILTKLNINFALKISKQFEYAVSIILKAFALLIPLFVIGFIVKLQFEGTIHVIIKDYTKVFALALFAQIAYLTLLYMIVSKLNVKVFIKNIKNMLSAAVLGFTTMSSAASMPLTILGVENNAKNKNFIGSIIPLTVNIHLIGDCLTIPIFAFAVLKNYNMPAPEFASYLIFTLYFVLAKFSVAAVPGGGIIVMLPILGAHLGFNSEMMSLITALYILFDPIITCVNILGNGAFALGLDQLTSEDTRNDKEVVLAELN